jgi:hypothetical protein
VFCDRKQEYFANVQNGKNDERLICHNLFASLVGSRELLTSPTRINFPKLFFHYIIMRQGFNTS